MGAVAVPAGLGGLAGVPGLGVHGRDDAIFGEEDLIAANLDAAGAAAPAAFRNVRREQGMNA